MTAAYLLLTVGIISLAAGIYLMLKTSKITRHMGESDQTITNRSFSSYSDDADETRLEPGLISETTVLIDETAEMPEESRSSGLHIDEFQEVEKKLGGLYRVDRILGEGAMGKVYLCTNLKIGNQWAVKHVHHNANEAVMEEEILKKLNHLHLPRIIDLFNDHTGTYIVQSYIEGSTLEEKIFTEERFNEEQICDWGIQLAEVLGYLHSRQPYPIIHRDLKPSNIMITAENKVVVIDFGISKEHAQHIDEVKAATRRYAPPEQLTGYTDERSDIYSLGMVIYKLITGNLPDSEEELRIQKYASAELSAILRKCIESDPDQRYQTAEELKQDFHKIKRKHYETIYRYKVMRTAAAVLGAVFLLSTGLGAYSYSQERTVRVSVEPSVISLSEQQSGELLLTKTYSSGKQSELQGDSVQWTVEDSNIARVENGRIVGMNAGKTIITGRYLNQELKIQVIVNSQDLTNVSLIYDTAYEASILAGNGERDTVDGLLAEANFTAPASITRLPDGTLYVVDSGFLRKIAKDKVSTITIEPDYIEPDIVRANARGEIYFASREWIAEDETYQKGIYKLLDDSSLQLIDQSSAAMRSYSDFVFDSQGRIFTVERDVFEEKSVISIIDPLGKEKPGIWAETDFQISSIAIDEKGNLYAACAEQGLIYKWDSNKQKMQYFAGVEGENNFIDGQAERFFEPLKIKAFGDSIYVLDHAVIRRIALLDGEKYDVKSVAGQVTEQKGSVFSTIGYEIIWDSSGERDFAVDKNGSLYVSDPVASTIIKIEYNSDNQQIPA